MLSPGPLPATMKWKKRNTQKKFSAFISPNECYDDVDCIFASSEINEITNLCVVAKKYGTTS